MKNETAKESGNTLSVLVYIDEQREASKNKSAFGCNSPFPTTILNSPPLQYIALFSSYVVSSYLLTEASACPVIFGSAHETRAPTGLLVFNT